MRASSKTLVRLAQSKRAVLQRRRDRLRQDVLPRIAALEAQIAALDGVIAGLTPAPAPSAPVIAVSSFEKGDPVEFIRAFNALSRIEGTGPPDETHDPVQDAAILGRLDAADLAEVCKEYTARVGPIQRFTQENGSLVQNPTETVL